MALIVACRRYLLPNYKFEDIYHITYRCPSLIRTLNFPFLLMLLFWACEMLEIRLLRLKSTEALSEVLHLRVPLKRISLRVRAVLTALGSFPANSKLYPIRYLLLRRFHTTFPLLRNSPGRIGAPELRAFRILLART